LDAHSDVTIGGDTIRLAILLNTTKWRGKDYLILFAPHAFVSQCQKTASRLLSLSVFPPISTHFIATPGVPSTSPFLKSFSILRGPKVKLLDFTQNLKDHLQTLYAQ